MNSARNIFDIHELTSSLNDFSVFLLRKHEKNQIFLRNHKN